MEDSLEHFLQANAAALDTAGVPLRLRPSIWGRIEAKKFGSLDPTTEEKLSLFDLTVVDDVPCIVAARSLIPRAAVFVFPHEWTFESLEQAKQHLQQSPELVSSLCSLITSVNVIQLIPSQEVIDPVEHILSNLSRIAFSYQITAYSPDADNDEVTTYYYCVVSDPFGPAVIPLTQSKEPTLTAFVLVDQRTLKAYTVLFPQWIKEEPSNGSEYFTVDDDEEDAIPEGSIITRGPLRGI